MFWVAALAIEYSVSGLVSTSSLLILRMSDERNTCWLLMRLRSLPSPTP